MDAIASKADVTGCDLILTTGGTGPAPRDVTPEATMAVADKLMPGFGEQMRRISLEFVPTAILSRQVAVISPEPPIFGIANDGEIHLGTCKPSEITLVRLAAP